jgi:hypothetical protein
VREPAETDRLVTVVSDPFFEICAAGDNSFSVLL